MQGRCHKNALRATGSHARCTGGTPAAQAVNRNGCGSCLAPLPHDERTGKPLGLDSSVDVEAFAAMGVQARHAKGAALCVVAQHIGSISVRGVVEADPGVPVSRSAGLLRTGDERIGEVPVVWALVIGCDDAHAVLVGIVVRTDERDVQHHVLADIGRHVGTAVTDARGLLAQEVAEAEEILGLGVSANKADVAGATLSTRVFVQATRRETTARRPGKRQDEARGRYAKRKKVGDVHHLRPAISWSRGQDLNLRPPGIVVQ